LEEKPAAAAAPANTAGAVISQLVGKKVLQLSDNHSAVPLLHPIAHSLPFSASLHIYSQHSDPVAAAAKSANKSRASRGLYGTDTRAESTLVELHYVISGKNSVPHPPPALAGCHRSTTQQAPQQELLYAELS
jgi:hypothetical protein